MAPFEERVARNEALFREVNERGHDIRARTDPGDDSTFMCECGNDHCWDHIRMPLLVYETVRANPRRFLVKPGHVIPEIEHVVAQTDEYAIVEKDTPTSVRIVEKHDPRS